MTGSVSYVKMRLMKIAFLASEVAPFAKTGGLADVAGALPKFLAQAGEEVQVFMPLFREVKKKKLKLQKVIDERVMPLGKKSFPFSVWKYCGPFGIYFIDNDEFYDRDGLYGTSAGDFPDNALRFAFFSRACLETFKALDFSPKVLHCHDWQTASSLAFLRYSYGDDPFYKSIRSLFTIHNLAYQGLFERSVLGKIGLPDRLFNMRDLEYYGRVNFLKAGILYADAVSTVSPRYSREIQTPEFGYGLEGLLRERKDSLFGILNGVDYSDWDPATDPLLPARFSPTDREGKKVCKKELAKIFGLQGSSTELPIMGMVSRLAGQKGLDIVSEALDDIISLGVNLVILGTGDEKIQDALRRAQKGHPGRLGLMIAFNDKVARTIYGGSDMLLIPSRYEPCGLTQMYGLKYGAVPVVRATGGLDDTIEEYDPAARSGNGFKFEEYSAPALVKSVETATSFYRRKDDWDALLANAMACDYSWNSSVREYIKLYRKIACA